ncbi:PACE efflux transporter [Vibrio mexicanus]|uniref:PACE efflux transporter n=1 Tax=Vibrio mexicanus TaxID=1004326 RepID=UPI00063C9FFE|nr:PACE efflux transporter [Vibrio mexicanus]
MNQQAIGRTHFDRIRHTLFFELGLLGTLVPISSLFMSQDKSTVGLVALALSVLAMLWNMAFNYAFYVYLIETQGHCQKSKRQRLNHALLFELGLILITIPILAWSLGLSLIDAFILDIGFVVYALFYAWGFNLAYDRMFPIPYSVQNSSF